MIRAASTLVLFIFICFALAVSGFAVSSEWDLKKDKEGIQVYTRKVGGSPMREFKGVTKAKGSLASAIALFESVEEVPHWMYRCVEFKKLEEKNQDEQIFYFRQELPWPAAERDFVYYRLRKQDPTSKTVTYELSELSGMYPQQKNVVRIPYLRSFWEFVAQRDGMIQVSYRVHSDPGGKIPKWIVNKVNVDLPFHSLQKFRELLEKTSGGTPND